MSKAGVVACRRVGGVSGGCAYWSMRWAAPIWHQPSGQKHSRRPPDGRRRGELPSHSMRGGRRPLAWSRMTIRMGETDVFRSLPGRIASRLPGFRCFRNFRGGWQCQRARTGQGGNGCHRRSARKHRPRDRQGFPWRRTLSQCDCRHHRGCSRERSPQCRRRRSRISAMDCESHTSRQGLYLTSRLRDARTGSLNLFRRCARIGFTLTEAGLAETTAEWQFRCS